MTAPKKIVTVPEVVDVFRRYWTRFPTWGSLHIVLEDSNLDDESVAFCYGYAREHGDREGVALARICEYLTPTQRAKLGRMSRGWPWPSGADCSNLRTEVEQDTFNLLLRLDVRWLDATGSARATAGHKG